MKATWITLGILVVFWAALTVFMMRKKIYKKKVRSEE